MGRFQTEVQVLDQEKARDEGEKAVARLSFKDIVPSENDRGHLCSSDFPRHFKQKALTLPPELGSLFSTLLRLSVPITIRFPSPIQRGFLVLRLAWHGARALLGPVGAVHSEH